MPQAIRALAATIALAMAATAGTLPAAVDYR